MSVNCEPIDSPAIAGLIAHAIRNVPFRLREDARQEAALAVLVTAPKFDPSRGVTLRSFLALRTQGAVTDFLRGWCPMTRSHQAKVQAGEAPPVKICALDNLTQADPGKSPEQECADSELWARVAALDARQAHILRGIYIRGDSAAVLALELGCNQGKIATLRMKALSRLRDIYPRGAIK